MAREPPLLATVQARITGSGLEIAAGDTSLGGLVSLDYGKVIQVEGKGELSTSDRRTLQLIAQSRRTLPRRLVGAYDVPLHREVYRLLLGAGMDLIGTKTLRESWSLLAGETSGADPKS